MRLLSISKHILYNIFLFSSQILFGLGMPEVSFRNVAGCFKPGYELYAPMFGSMALSSGFIENMRFYNVMPGIDPTTGERKYVKDTAFKKDPIMEVVLILFPSPGGQLTVEGTAESNFGKLCDEKDLATIFNFVYGLRKRIKNKNAPLPQRIDKIIDELDNTIDKKAIHDVKDKFKNANGTKLLLNIARAVLLEAENKKDSGSEIKNFYPEYMIEKVLGAFFCHKFASQENIKNLLFALHDDIVNKVLINGIDRLIEEGDIALALANLDQGRASLDDIWIILNRVDFSKSILPYKSRQGPISNGLAKKYLRSEDRLSEENFPDCVEVTIRHIINMVLYDSDMNKFSLEKIDALMSGKNASYIQNLRDFYVYQTPRLANVGADNVRNQWNRVVADLGGDIHYKRKFDGQGSNENNEIVSGMLNMVRVIAKIFDVELGSEPMYTQGQEEEFKTAAQDRITECFAQLFESLHPKEIVSTTTFSDITVQKGDLFGNMVIQISDSTTKEELFCFTIKVSEVHMAIQRIDFLTKKDLLLSEKQLNNIEKKLNTLHENNCGEAYFFSDDLIDRSSIKVSLVYKIFGQKNIAGDVKALEVCQDFYDKVNVSFIVKNIINNYFWEDLNSRRVLSSAILSATWKKNQSFFNSIKMYIKKIYLTYKNIETFDISEFGALKNLNFFQCKKLSSFTGESDSIEELVLETTNIKILDITPFRNLKVLELWNCRNLNVSDTKEFAALSGPLESLETFLLSDMGIEIFDCSAFKELKDLFIWNCKDLKVFKGGGENILKIHLYNVGLEMLNILNFQKLEELSLEKCAFLKYFNSRSDSLQTLSISDCGIEVLDVSRLKVLKTLKIEGCQKLKSIIVSDLFPKEKKEALQKQYPGIVTVLERRKRRR